MTMKSKPQHVARAARNVAQDPRWAAVVARDPAADDKFVYAVKTTGVYCKPSSGSRLPEAENVEFFDTAKAAEAAGYRPSAAADQTTLATEHASLVAQACRTIEHAETAPNLQALAKSARMSPFHFHRVFKEVTGLTPKGYASAHRARRMRERLNGSTASITNAIYDAGFNSNSRFYEASDRVLGMRAKDYRAGGA